MLMDERARRIGENEAVFRTVNEEVQGLNERFSADSGTMSMICECGRVDCMERIDLHAGEYESLRRDATRFAIKPGHETPDVESVVERHDRFWVVKKDEGEPAEIARSTDPRS
jgi:hypothetical protein